MSDLSVKDKEPWSGPGRDPRKDKFDTEAEVNGDGDEEGRPAGEDDEEEDSGEDIDRSTFCLLLWL